MATSQVIDLAANRAAPRTASTPQAVRANRLVAFLGVVADVFREARELERRTLGEGRYRHLGNS